MTTHLGLQRILLPSAQVSSLTTGSITLPSARGVFVPSTSFESISSTTLSSTSSTISFSSIPQTYKHLQIRVLSAQTNATQGARLFYNGDTTTANYWAHAETGNGSSAASSNGNNNYGLYYSGTTSGYYNAVIDILDYTNTNKRKMFRSIQGYDLNGSGIVVHLSGLWNDTAAITSMQFSDLGSIFQIGSSFALYGIRGA
jgi:hypothetical protein